MNDSILLQVNSLKVAITNKNKHFFPVNDVSFQINRGECVCMVGESGSGKSVTALALMGLLPSPPFQYVAGEILFNQQPIHKMSQKALERIRGRHMAMIFQEPMTALNPVFTIGEQIAEAIIAHFSFKSDEVTEKVLTALKMAGLPDPVLCAASYPHQLSGGMRQRAMIAMALAGDPSLLIADEPTTALDVSTQDQILQLLNDLSEQKGLSLLFITHNMGVVAQVAKRVMIMYAGRIVEVADVKDFFAMPKHPYSKALLNSIPRLVSANGENHKRLSTIPGQVPSMGNIPSGCAFHDRCPHKFKKCEIEIPPLIKITDRIEVACHLYC